MTDLQWFFFFVLPVCIGILGWIASEIMLRIDR